MTRYLSSVVKLYNKISKVNLYYLTVRMV